MNHILVAWTTTHDGQSWEVLRHENGKPILVGRYANREFAWGTMQAGRAFHLEDPAYYELLPAGRPLIPRPRLDGLAPTWMKVLLLVLIAIVVILAVLLIWQRSENERRCRAALGPGSTFYGHDLCSPPAVHVDGLVFG